MYGVQQYKAFVPPAVVVGWARAASREARHLRRCCRRGLARNGACLGARDEDPVGFGTGAHGVCATAGGSVREERSEAQNRAVRHVRSTTAELLASPGLAERQRVCRPAASAAVTAFVSSRRADRQAGRRRYLRCVCVLAVDTHTTVTTLSLPCLPCCISLARRPP